MPENLRNADNPDGSNCVVSPVQIPKNGSKIRVNFKVGKET